MPGPLQPMTKADWSGGLNVVVSPYALKPNEVLRADNLLLDEVGALRVRDGQQAIDTAPDATDRIVGLASLTLEDQTRYRLAIVRLANGTQVLQQRNSQPWATLGAFDTPYDTPSLVPFVNQLVIAAGYEVPWVTDGTTMTRLSGMNILAGAQWLVQHQNALWAWNTAAVSTTYDGPSSLRQSDVENANSWPTSNQTFIARGDGQVGMGLGVFTLAEAGISPDDILVAFKNFSSYQVQGVYGAGSSPTITRIKTDMGCVAGRSIQFVPGLGLIRLTHRGFALYNGLNDRVMSDTIRPYIFGHGDLQGLNWEQVKLSCATQTQNPPLYVCACPSAASTRGLDRVFVFDVNAKAWTVLTFPQPFAVLALILEPPTLPYVLAGQDGGGTVYQLFNQATRDGATPIDWLVRFPPVGPPHQRIFLRAVKCTLFPVAAGQRVTFTIALGPVAQGQTRTITRVVTVGAATYPTAPLALLNEAEVVADFGVVGEVLSTEVSGSGSVGIRAASWDMRRYPVTRPLRA